MGINRKAIILIYLQKVLKNISKTQERTLFSNKRFETVNIAYIRVSTNKQELDSQKLEIMEYCHKNNIILDEILEVKISSTKSQEKRKIKDLKQKLKSGDLLIATELSRLGRSMLEIINLVLEFNSNNIKFLFLRQMELSNFNNPASKLILSVYAYLAEDGLLKNEN